MIRAKRMEFLPRASAIALLAFLFLMILPAVADHSAQAKSVAAYRNKVHEVFIEWVTSLWPEAEKAGISPKTYVAAFKGVTLNWKLPGLEPPHLKGFGAPPKKVKRAEKKKKRQPEFDVPERYFPERSLKNLAAIGRRHLEQWKEPLAKIEKTYGVHKSVLLAIWGRETAFGRAKLPHYAVRSIATLAFMGKRKEYFRQQLLGALRILEQKHVTRKDMKSSWAGAMGHTQFMPSDFEKHAVDFTGDGKRDIWSTIPDALASTANYLKAEGWESGKTWGYEIHQVEGLDCTKVGPDGGKPLKEWVADGATRTFNRTFSAAQLEDTAYLLMPAGTYGPAFLVLKNFYVIKEYNTSDVYALYVGHVADRIGVDRKFEGKWKKVDSFTRDAIRKMQQIFTDKGLYSNKIDGLIGSRTRSSIGKYQQSANLPVTCYPTNAQLKQLAAKAN